MGILYEVVGGSGGKGGMIMCTHLNDTLDEGSWGCTNCKPKGHDESKVSSQQI